MELGAFLDALIVAAGALAFAAIEYLPRWFPRAFEWVLHLQPFAKRLLAWSLSAVIAIGAYLGKVVMLYAELPQDWRLAVALLFEIGTAAFGLSQIMHGIVVTRNKPAPDPTSRAGASSARV